MEDGYAGPATLTGPRRHPTRGRSGLHTDSLAQVIAQLTPGKLEEIIRRLAESQPQENRSGVSAERILSAIVPEADLGEGRARSIRYQHLKQAVQDGVNQIPGMRYVHTAMNGYRCPLT